MRGGVIAGLAQLWRLLDSGKWLSISAGRIPKNRRGVPVVTSAVSVRWKYVASISRTVSSWRYSLIHGGAGICDPSYVSPECSITSPHVSVAGSASRILKSTRGYSEEGAIDIARTHDDRSVLATFNGT